MKGRPTPKGGAGASLSGALARHREGDLGGAEALCRLALRQDSRCAEALHLLGCLAAQRGSADEAVGLLSQAIAIDRKAAAYHYNLANVLMGQGRMDEAISHYRKAIKLKPDYALAHNNLGLALAPRAPEEALKALLAATRIQPDLAEAQFNLGNAWKALGRLDSAVQSYREALGRGYRSADVHYNLANTLKAAGRLEEAEQSYREALSLKGEDAQALTNLAGTLLEQGRQEDAICAYREALSIDERDTLAHSGLITALCYLSPDPAQVCREATAWHSRHAAPLRQGTGSFPNSPDPVRRLRVGYCSPDFRHHAAAYFIEPLLAHHDHGDFEILCYSDVGQPDTVSSRLRGHADKWTDCAGMGDEDMARRIEEDGVDILVDLAGHTAGNRLRVFTRKPAPLQVSWFGLPATTGLKSMDYRFSDGILDPAEDSESYYSERLIRLSRFYACFQPDAGSPEVRETPALRKGYVTFASFNNFAKVTPQIMESWAEILGAAPSSRLLLKAAGLTDPGFGGKVRQFFEAKGIGSERILLQGKSGIGDFLALHGEVDAVLDTYPFNGGVTTCHALWMGVPVITLAGRGAAARVGKSILTRLGLQELVADTPQGYRELAAALAHQPEHLDNLRKEMRARMEMAGLLDGKGFAREVEGAYREIWRVWCAKNGGAS